VDLYIPAIYRFKNACNSVKREVLCNIIVEFSINAAPNYNIKELTNSFQMWQTFKYSRMIIRNQNYIWKEFKSRLNLGNNCIKAVQIVVCPLLSLNAKINIHHNRIWDLNLIVTELPAGL
jgi:hypothetical protein